MIFYINEKYFKKTFKNLDHFIKTIFEKNVNKKFVAKIDYKKL